MTKQVKYVLRAADGSFYQGPRADAPFGDFNTARHYVNEGAAHAIAFQRECRIIATDSEEYQAEVQYSKGAAIMAEQMRQAVDKKILDTLRHDVSINADTSFADVKCKADEVRAELDFGKVEERMVAHLGAEAIEDVSKRLREYSKQVMHAAHYSFGVPSHLLRSPTSDGAIDWEKERLREHSKAARHGIMYGAGCNEFMRRMAVLGKQIDGTAFDTGNHTYMQQQAYCDSVEAKCTVDVGIPGDTVVHEHSGCKFAFKSGQLFGIDMNRTVGKSPVHGAPYGQEPAPNPEIDMYMQIARESLKPRALIDTNADNADDYPAMMPQPARDKYDVWYKQCAGDLSPIASSVEVVSPRHLIVRDNDYPNAVLRKYIVTLVRANGETQRMTVEAPSMMHVAEHIVTGATYEGKHAGKFKYTSELSTSWCTVEVA